MVFCNPKSSLILGDHLQFDGKRVSRASVVHYLGFVIGSHLSWQYHVLHVRDKISKGLGMLRRCKQILPSDCLRSIYFAFVHSYLQYGVQFWGIACENNLYQLRILQKGCIRAIVNEHYLAHCVPTAKSLGILMVDELHTFSVACFMYNVFHNSLGSAVVALFNRTNFMHLHNTRHSNKNYLVPHVGVTVRRWFIVCQGPLIWNSLSDNVCMSCSLSTYLSIALKLACLVHMFRLYLFSVFQYSYVTVFEC
jgi:hypothetical protein